MRALGIGKSDVGRQRERNEDALLVENDLGLFAVADGMGGLRDGDLASRVALRTLRSVVHERAPSGRELTEEELSVVLADAVRMASRSVFRISMSRYGRPEMGSTLTSVVVRGPYAVMAHMGDSRLYLLRDGFAFQMTTDHTLAQQLADAGVIEQAEVQGHHLGHTLVRTVGLEFHAEPQTRLIELLWQDRLLLCTDGLTRYVPGPTWLAPRIAMDDPRRSTEALIAHANAAGGHDNITAIVVRMERQIGDRSSDAASRPAERPLASVRE